MKTLITSVLTGLALCCASLAIPQVFGNRFFGAIGQQFEDFAIAAVGPGAELKGEWVPVRGKEDSKRLDMTAVVFGVPASEITAENSGSSGMRYRVVYRAADDRKRGAKAATLRERITAGVRAYAGSEAKGTATYKGAQIKVEDATKGDVSVVISKAP